MKDIKIIIQARTGSTRLLGKMLLPFFQNYSIFELILQRLIAAFGAQRIILATTEEEKDNPLVKKAGEYNVSIFRGNEKDVLQRFIDCAEAFKVEELIRVCADNPFIDITLMERLLNHKSDADYLSYKVKETPAIKTHYGFFAERVKLAALKKAGSLTDESFFHEHVTNYIYSHPEKFKIDWLQAPESISERSDIRLTIDTADDFKNCQSVYSRLNSGFMYTDVIRAIDSIPGISESMSQQIEQNGK